MSQEAKTAEFGASNGEELIKKGQKHIVIDPNSRHGLRAFFF